MSVGVMREGHRRIKLPLPSLLIASVTFLPSAFLSVFNFLSLLDDGVSGSTVG